jgi:hypothetical protein
MEELKYLPDWFNGELYTQGAIVTNPKNCRTYELNALDLSIYDFIMGCVYIGKQDSTFVKALTWFRKTNPQGYQVLLKHLK